MNTLQKIVGSIKPIKVEAYRSVSYALELMDKENTDALGVTFFNEFAGIFTRSDLFHKVINKNLNPLVTSINDVMVFDVIKAAPDMDIKTAYGIMLKHNVSHLPVLQADRFLGIVSEDDIRQEILALLNKADSENRLIINYIYGESYGLSASY